MTASQLLRPNAELLANDKKICGIKGFIIEAFRNAGNPMSYHMFDSVVHPLRLLHKSDD